MNIFLQVEQREQAGIIADMPELDEMITMAEAAKLANGRYSRPHITRATRDGDIPGAIRIGQMWLVPRSAFERWLSEERRPGPKAED